MKTWRPALCGTFLALAACGCGKTDQPGGARPTPSGEAGAATNQGGTKGVVEPEGCAAPQPGASPLLRLDGFQLANTVRYLFGDAPTVVTLLEPLLAELDSDDQGSDARAVPRDETVELYHQLAHRAGLALSKDAAALQAVAGCDPGAGESTCRDAFIERWLTLTSRRPPVQDERNEMLTIFDSGSKLGDGTFASGVRAVVEVTLQSPDFLYLLELGAGQAQGDVVPLTSHETASRLAYYLTASMPDAELRAAASAGELGVMELEAQARRLIGGAANRRLARRFMSRLLSYDWLTEVPAQQVPNPAYTAELLALTHEESGRFIEDVFFDGAGTFEALWAEPSTWVNGPLAQFYGIAGVTGDAFQKVDVKDLGRAGVLTQSTFLTATSRGGRPNPVVRGLRVLRDVLCAPPPPPPADLATPLPPESPNGTTRQKLEAATAEPRCRDCHKDINPLGYAFDHFDGLGLWRDTEAGQPIDTTGTLYKTDAAGDFSGAVELVGRISRSQDAQACFVANWMTHAYGREESPDDACAREQVETALRDSGGNLVEMLVALAQTDQLRYRLASELAP